MKNKNMCIHILMQCQENFKCLLVCISFPYKGMNSRFKIQDQLKSKNNNH